jgi:hypothetical protein
MAPKSFLTTIYSTTSPSVYILHQRVKGAVMKECKGVAAARKSKDVVMAAGSQPSRVAAMAWWKQIPPRPSGAIDLSPSDNNRGCTGKQPDFSYL